MKTDTNTNHRIVLMPSLNTKSQEITWNMEKDDIVVGYHAVQKSNYMQTGLLVVKGELARSEEVKLPVFDAEKQVRERKRIKQVLETISEKGKTE